MIPSVEGGIGLALSALVATSAIGLAVLYALRRRSITTVLTATVLVPVLSLAVGVLATAALVPADSVDRIAIPVAVAVLLSIAIAVGVSKLVMRASVALRRAVELLGDGTDLALPRTPTAELSALSGALDEAQQRLREARAREDDLERSRRQMLAGIGHDLRTPLARLRSVVESLQEEGTSDPAVLDSYLGVLDSQTARLSALVDDVVDLTRITSGLLEAAPAAVAVEDLVSNALVDARPDAERRGVSLTGEAAAGVTVLADLRMVTRILDNLVDNAIAETPAGAAVTIRATERADGVVLEVHDTCGGISAQDLPRLFEPGFRGDTSRRSDGRGFGLGLTIAHALSATNGAQLSVYNTAEGCVFAVLFPSTAPASGEAHRDVSG
jgi:signal transduction histidine kinase